jgi:hypothetical protein
MSVFFSVILAGIGLAQAGPIVGVFSTAKSAAHRVFEVCLCVPLIPGSCLSYQCFAGNLCELSLRLLALESDHRH